MAIDGVTRQKILFNSDPEPTEVLLGLEALALGLVYLLGPFVAGICRSPVAVGLLMTVGDNVLHLIGALLFMVAAMQWGAVYQDALRMRRFLLVVEIGWWLFVTAVYAQVLGFALGPLLFAVFTTKAAWALWRLFQPGVKRHRNSQ